jgi:hypothetical protein
MSRNVVLQKYESPSKGQVLTAIGILLCLVSPFLGFVWLAAGETSYQPTQQVTLALAGTFLFLLGVTQLHCNAHQEGASRGTGLVRAWRWTTLIANRGAYLFPILFCLSLMFAPVVFTVWINELFGLLRQNSKMRAVLDWPLWAPRVRRDA